MGALPSAGKTLLLAQWAFDALCDDPDLKVLFANVEMTSDREQLDRAAQHAAPGLTSTLLADCHKSPASQPTRSMRPRHGCMEVLDAAGGHTGGADAHGGRHYVASDAGGELGTF